MPIPLYTIKDLSLSKSGKNILHIKQFDIHRGACYVINGRMGSGKTAFLDILYSRGKPGKGEIIFEEKKLQSYSLKEYHDQIAVVHQEFNAPWGTVRKYLTKTIGKYSHIKNVEKRLVDISRKMEINHLLDKKMKDLTPGEKRWVVLAAQIAADTKVLFIDEFEQHLSSIDIKNLVNILYRKTNYDGVTIITSTQNKEVLSKIASVTITLENGRITSVRSSSNKRRGEYRNNKRNMR